MSFAPAFAHFTPFMSVSSQSSSDRSPNSSATSPAMRALVAAWLADVSGTQAMAAGLKEESHGKEKTRSIIRRLAAALHINWRTEDNPNMGHAPAIRAQGASSKRIRKNGNSEKLESSQASTKHTTGFLSTPSAKATRDNIQGKNSVALDEILLDHSTGTIGGVSALCSSLYSTLASKKGSDTLRYLPFLFADTSAEARSLLEAMRKAHAKTIESARREQSQSTNLAKLLGTVGAALLFVMNPFK